MHQLSLPINTTGVIYLDNIHGDLQIKGWEQTDVFIRTSHEENLSVVNEGDILHIACQDDINLRVPLTCNIHIGQAQGDARFKFLENRFEIEKIHGSVIFHKVAEVQLDKVEGDLMANKITGNMAINQVKGDVFINRLEKNCAIQNVSGSLHLNDVHGDIYASAEGDAFLHQKYSTQSNCEIHSRGDIHCQLPKGINAQVTLVSNANSIDVLLPTGNTRYKEGKKQFTLGEGNARLMISAEGKIIFSCQDADWQTFGDFEIDFDTDIQEISQKYIQQMEGQFEKQINLLNGHMEKITETLESLNLPEAEVERMVERARQSSVIAAQRAQEKMQRAQIKLEQKLAAAKRKSEARAWHHSHDRPGIHIQWASKSKTLPPSDEQISPDERLIILRMLEQKKITLEEAENLLRTLEGEEG